MSNSSMDPVRAHPELMVRSRRVWLSGANEPKPAALRIQSGKIVEILELTQEADQDIPFHDYGNALIMPGVVDTHAHINEPGRTEWEGFETATRAAAAGGITTVIDMPLNSIPATTSVAALDAKASAASDHCLINYGFWGGVIPGNADELRPMIENGVLGFKCFLIESGVEEFPHVNEADLRLAMPILAQAGRPLLVHAELECGTPPQGADARRYSDFVRSRPAQWEVEAIRMMIRLARETRCHVHIVHLSAAAALPDLRRARAEGIPITVETCPHYLTFCEEEINDGATHFKCAPPIRDRSNQEALWEGLRAGDIDFIVSDHSPCHPNLKLQEEGDFDRAWGGIAGLQFSLPAVWSAMRRRNLGLKELTSWMCEGPARFAGLRKGVIQVGADADLVVWEPNAEFTPERIHHRHSLTPYSGRSYFGAIQATYVNGIRVYAQGEFSSTKAGQWIRRS